MPEKETIERVRPPKKGATSRKTRKSAESAYRKGQSGSKKKPSRRRSRAVKGALGRESRRAASGRALARQARSAARRRSAGSRSAAAKKAAKTRARRK